VAHVVLFVINLAVISWAAQTYNHSQLLDEFNLARFIDHPVLTLTQGLLLPVIPRRDISESFRYRAVVSLFDIFLAPFSAGFNRRRQMPQLGSIAGLFRTGNLPVRSSEISSRTPSVGRPFALLRAHGKDSLAPTLKIIKTPMTWN
jgi:hypothetical protein